MGIRIDYLVAAAFMSAPGGILMAKIIMPDEAATPPEPEGRIELPEARISAEGPAALVEAGMPNEVAETLSRHHQLEYPIPVPTTHPNIKRAMLPGGNFTPSFNQTSFQKRSYSPPSLAKSSIGGHPSKLVYKTGPDFVLRSTDL